MRRFALLALFIAMVAMAFTYLVALIGGSAPGWSVWTVSVATSVAMIASMALGAARRGRPRGGLGRLALPLLLVLLLLAGGFALALLLPAAGEPILLGLPRRAAILVYGVGLLPVVILPVAYALTFEQMTLSEDDIEKVQRAAQARRRAGDSADTA